MFVLLALEEFGSLHKAGGRLENMFAIQKESTTALFLAKEEEYPTDVPMVMGQVMRTMTPTEKFEDC